MSYRVFDGHEAVTDPAPRGAVPADVGEGTLKVTVRSAERHLLYGLVQDQVLLMGGEKKPREHQPHHQHGGWVQLSGRECDC